MILSYVRTLVLYLLLIAVIRLMGKRQIGQMEASEFVVTMLVANLASIPMQDSGIPLFSGAVPILTVLGMELVLSSLSLRSLWVRRILCGKPVILMENGRILQANLRKTRVTLDELMGLLREKDVLDVTCVQYAILETNGNLSVFPYPQEQPPSARAAGITTQKQSMPVVLVSDGTLMEENLKASGKNIFWVQRYLQEQKVTLAETWMLSVDEEGKVVFFRKE